MAVAIPTYKTTVYNDGAEATAFVVDKPTSLAVGDLLICLISYSNTSDLLAAQAGWTEFPVTATHETSRLHALYKLATTTDVAASNFTITIDSEESGAIVMLRLTGVSTLQIPYAVSQSKAEVNDDKTVSIDNTFDALANSFLLFVVNAKTGNSYSDLTVSDYAIATNNPSWTELLELSWIHGGSSNSTISIATATRTQGGATGNATFTLNTGATDTYVSGNCMIINLLENKSFTKTETVTATESDLLDLSSLTYTGTITETDSVETEGDNWDNESKNSSSWTNTSK